MSWAIYIILALLCLIIVRQSSWYKLPGLNKNAAVVFLLLKIAAAFTLWYVYTIYYPDKTYADIWKFYNDSAVIHEALKENPGDYFSMITGIGIDDEIEQKYLMRMNHWHQPFESNLFNDSHTIIRFNALIRLFSFGNYHIHALMMCMLSLAGLCALYRWMFRYIPQWKKALAAILFLFPSLLFWSSGVLKEGLMLFALGFTIEQLWKFESDKKYSRLPVIVSGLALLAITKLYMLAFLIPALALSRWIKFKPGFAPVKFTIAVLALFATGKIIESAFPQLSPARILALKHNDFVRLAHGGTYMYNDTAVVYLEAERRANLVCSNGDSCTLEKNVPFQYWRIKDNFADTLTSKGNSLRVNYKILTDIPKAGSIIDNTFMNADYNSVVKNIPRALLNTLFRPFLWETKSPMLILPFLENIILLIMILAAMVFRKTNSARDVFWFCVMFAAVTLVVIGITTPVLGAIVRYRITALPFVMLALLIITDRKKLLIKWPGLARFL